MQNHELLASFRIAVESAPSPLINSAYSARPVLGLFAKEMARDAVAESVGNCSTRRTGERGCPFAGHVPTESGVNRNHESSIPIASDDTHRSVAYYLAG